MLTTHIADVLAADETDALTYLGWSPSEPRPVYVRLPGARVAENDTDRVAYVANGAAGWRLAPSGLLATAPATQIHVQFPGVAVPAYLVVN